MLSDEERLGNGSSLTAFGALLHPHRVKRRHIARTQSSISESRRSSSSSAAWLQPLQGDHRKLITHPKEMNLELLPCSKFLTDLLNYIKSESSDRPSESIVNSGLCHLLTRSSLSWFLNWIWLMRTRSKSALSQVFWVQQSFWKDIRDFVTKECTLLWPLGANSQLWSIRFTLTSHCLRFHGKPPYSELLFRRQARLFNRSDFKMHRVRE